MGIMGRRRNFRGIFTEAVNRALDGMPDLVENRRELTDMWYTDYDEDEIREMIRKEAAEQGREQGEERGILQSLRNLMANLGLSKDEAMDALGVEASRRQAFVAML